jgi:hypothetical protein
VLGHTRLGRVLSAGRSRERALLVGRNEQSNVSYAFGHGSIIYHNADKQDQ